jgi:hypothetical protein
MLKFEINQIGAGCWMLKCYRDGELSWSTEVLSLDTALSTIRAETRLR